MSQPVNLPALPVKLLGLLFFSLPLAYWPGFLEAASLPRYFLIGALGGLALLVLLGSARNKASHFSWHPLFGFFVAFFFWASITTAWSPDAGNSLIDISRLAAMIILSFLGMQVVRRPEFTSLLLPAFFGGSLLAAIIGIGQHYGYNPLELRLQEHNIASTFINRNHAAVYFDFVVPSSLVAILLYKNTGYRVLAAATAGAGMAFLLLNKNRGSLLALLVTLTVLTIILWSNKQFRQLAIERAYRVRRHFILALLVPFLVLILPSASSNQAEWNTALLENRVDSSTNIRINAYINTLPLILQQPLTGSGYGGFRMSFRPHATSVRPRSSLKEDNVMGALHNDPLQYLVELGLPGLLLALLIYLATLRIGWPTPDSKQDSSTVFLKLGLFLALLAAGIHSLVDFPLRLPASAALFWFFLGSLVGLAARKPRQRNISPGLQKALLGTVSAYLLFTLVFYFHYFKGSKDLYTATASIQKNDCRTAIDAIENSMQEFDLNYVTQNRYAQIHAFCNLPVTTQIAAMNRVLAYDPTNIRARLTRGILYLRQQTLDIAKEDLLYVARALPHRPFAYIGLADIAFLEGRYRKAEYLYKAGLKRAPEHAHALEMLARLASLPKAVSRD